MKSYFFYLVFFILANSLLFGFVNSVTNQSKKEWISLFDGESLQGWTASENSKSFSVQDGHIVAHGPRAHLFYTGAVQNHDFENFAFKADMMTTEGANSGIYFHTKYQKSGWPVKGYEVQINNTHHDSIKTGSLYGIDNIYDTPASDNKWFSMHIRIEGQTITIKVDGRTLVEYTEPENIDRKGRVLSSGTFALQAHDPESKVFYKNIMVSPF